MAKFTTEAPTNHWFYAQLFLDKGVAATTAEDAARVIDGIFGEGNELAINPESASGAEGTWAVELPTACEAVFDNQGFLDLGKGTLSLLVDCEPV